MDTSSVVTARGMRGPAIEPDVAASGDTLMSALSGNGSGARRVVRHLDGRAAHGRCGGAPAADACDDVLASTLTDGGALRSERSKWTGRWHRARRSGGQQGRPEQRVLGGLPGRDHDAPCSVRSVAVAGVRARRGERAHVALTQRKTIPAPAQDSGPGGRDHRRGQPGVPVTGASAVTMDHRHRGRRRVLRRLRDRARRRGEPGLHGPRSRRTRAVLSRRARAFLVVTRAEEPERDEPVLGLLALSHHNGSGERAKAVSGHAADRRPVPAGWAALRRRPGQRSATSGWDAVPRLRRWGGRASVDCRRPVTCRRWSSMRMGYPPATVAPD